MAAGFQTRVEELLHKALGIADPERAEFLQRNCGPDAELRCEVESLLDAHQAAGAFLETTMIHLKTPDTEAVSQPETSVVGAYRLLEAIADGEVCSVYLAARSDAEFDKRVAVKLFKLRIGSGQVLARFEQERQILASLDHPNIATLLDGGRTEDSRPYFVMELVDGQPIDEYCRVRRLSLEDRIELFRSVCTAVHFAHESLVIHRDLKPSNILVGADGVPKLLDFGIAKLVDPQRAPQSLEPTSTAVRLLTPRFASPEQLRGESVTTATDVYSLGVVLYELLSGCRPYRLEGLGLREIERVVNDQRPDPPSVVAKRPGIEVEGQTARDVGKSARRARQLAGDLDTIVLKAMHLEPHRRYRSAFELAEDLRRYLVCLPVEARPDSVRYRLGKFVQRNARLLITAGVALLMVMGLASYYTWRLTQEKQQAIHEREKAQEVTDFVKGLFVAADSSTSDAADITARELLDLGAERVETELEGQPDVQAEMLFELGQIYARMGLFEEAGAVHGQALELLIELGGPDDPRVAQLHRALARVLEDEAAVDHFLRAIDIYEDTYGPEDTKIAEALVSLGSVFHRLGRMEEAEEALQHGVRILESTAGDSTYLHGGYMALGTLYNGLGRNDLAKSFYEKHVTRATTLLGSEAPEVLLGRLNLAISYAKEGETDIAEREFVSVLPRYERRYGPEHPLVGYVMTNLGAIYFLQGRFDEAEPILLRAMTIFEQAGGRYSADVSRAGVFLGSMYHRQRRFSEADAQFSDAISILERYTPSSPTLANALTYFGSACREQGRHREAAELLRRAWQIEDEALPSNHLYRVKTLVGLARVLIDTGELTPAEEKLNAGLSIAEGLEMQGETTRRSKLASAEVWHAFGLLHAARGEAVQAGDAWRRSLAALEETDHESDDWGILNHRAVVLLHLGRIDEARLIVDRINGFSSSVASSELEELCARHLPERGETRPAALS